MGRPLPSWPGLIEIEKQHKEEHNDHRTRNFKLFFQRTRRCHDFDNNTILESFAVAWTVHALIPSYQPGEVSPQYVIEWLFATAAKSGQRYMVARERVAVAVRCLFCLQWQYTGNVVRCDGRAPAIVSTVLIIRTGQTKHPHYICIHIWNNRCDYSAIMHKLPQYCRQRHVRTVFVQRATIVINITGNAKPDRPHFSPFPLILEKYEMDKNRLTSNWIAYPWAKYSWCKRATETNWISLIAPTIKYVCETLFWQLHWTLVENIFDIECTSSQEWRQGFSTSF